jgi:hypothetical protein
VQQPASAAATDPNAIGATLVTTPNDSTPASNQNAVQALNTALTSLGLNQQEIQAFDQVANLINSFSPTAFSDLVSQFQQLAQRLMQATSATSSSQPVADGTTSNSATAPITDASAPATGATAANNTPSGGGLQIQELTIRFSSAETQGSGSNGGNSQTSAFNLQIEEVNITLTGGNNQVAQLQTPRPAGNPVSPGPAQSPASSSSAVA